MAMGYFDDSGSGNRDVICMAGYLADDSNWSAMTTDWNVLLKKYEIPFLHLADFKSAKGIYSDPGWKVEDPKIREALSGFIRTIAKHTIAGQGVTVDAVCYREIISGVKKAEKPQVFCFERLLRLVTCRLDGWQWKEPVCLIFDDSKDYAMQCYSNMWEIKTRSPELKQRIAGIAFGNDEYFAPLQAADLFAYATMLTHRYGDGVWAEDRIFHELLRDTEHPGYGKLHEGERWDREALEESREAIRSVCNRGQIKITERKRRPMLS